MPAVASSRFIRGLYSALGIMKIDQVICQGMGDLFCPGYSSSRPGWAHRGTIREAWSRGKTAAGGLASRCHM